MHSSPFVSHSLLIRIFAIAQQASKTIFTCWTKNVFPLPHTPSRAIAQEFSKVFRMSINALTSLFLPIVSFRYVFRIFSSVGHNSFILIALSALPFKLSYLLYQLKLLGLFNNQQRIKERNIHLSENTFQTGSAGGQTSFFQNSSKSAQDGFSTTPNARKGIRSV